MVYNFIIGLCSDVYVCFLLGLMLWNKNRGQICQLIKYSVLPVKVGSSLLPCCCCAETGHNFRDRVKIVATVIHIHTYLPNCKYMQESN